MQAKGPAADIHVHQGESLNHQFFDGAVETVSRFDDPGGVGEWVNIRFVNGGQMSVYTERPIVFVEPERH